MKQFLVRLTIPRRGERGQALVLMITIIAVFVFFAALAIDVSMWRAQRRDRQNDSDAAAFAGAQELLNRGDPVDMSNVPDMIQRATDSTYRWAGRNAADASWFNNGTPDIITGCWDNPPFDGKPDGVVADLSAPGANWFAGISNFFWESVVPYVGAHAKVCIGSPPDAEGLLPFGIPVLTSECFDNGTPEFGSTCDVLVRPAQGESGETGSLRLYTDGSTKCSDKNVGSVNVDFVNNVAYGADTTCASLPLGTSPSGCNYMSTDPTDIGKCAYSYTGNEAGAMMKGLAIRLTSEGQCDGLNPDAFFGHMGDGIDQWWEALSLASGGDIHDVVPGPGVVFQRRSNCTSPRLVTLVLIECYNDGKNQLPLQCPPDLDSQGPYPIVGFAGFFITGCRDSDAGWFNQHCLDNPPGNLKPGDPDPWGDPYLNNQGHIFMEGMFINYVDIGRHGGPLNRYGRMDIYLVE